MTADEIEKLARDRKPLPEHTTLPESCLYETMAGLWDAYRAQHLDRTQAHAAKMRILRQFAEFSASYRKYCEAFREQQDNIRRIGTLRTAIAREKMHYDLRTIQRKHKRALDEVVIECHPEK